MSSLPRALFLSGVAWTALSPAAAQPVPNAPALSMPPAIGTPFPAPQTHGAVGDVPLDLGALPGPASAPAVPPVEAGTRETAPGETDNRPSPGAAPSKDVAVTPVGGRAAHVLFDRFPVPIRLAPGHERLVRFPFVPMIDVPSSLHGLLEVQIIEDTAYLTATGPIPRTRLVAQAVEGGAKLPLDVEAADGSDPGPMLRIHLLKEDGAADDADAASGDRDLAETAVGMVELTRYAAQVLYAPTRLIPTHPGVRQEPVDRKPVVGLYRGGAVETAPLGAWSSGALHVTAIRFTNRSTRPVELDMERLRGRWIAATPQHWRLLPQGSQADTTAVYLVSDAPFSSVALWR